MKQVKAVCEKMNLDYKKVVEAIDNAIAKGLEKNGSWERQTVETILGNISDFSNKKEV